MTMTTYDITRPFTRVSPRANDIIFAVLIGIVLTGLSYLAGLAFGFIQEINWLEAFAVFTSYGSTWLCVKQRRFNYIFGAISTAAYAVLFFQYGLIASAILNAYLAPALVYGWIRWRTDANTKPVGWVVAKGARNWIPVYIAVTLAAWAVAAFVVVPAFGGQLALLDSAILALTILAQFLLDNKKMETWIIWALVNITAIYVYFSAELYLVVIQYIFFLANAVYAFFEWRKTLEPELEPV